MKQRISRLETKDQVKNPYMVQGLMDPQLLQKEMKMRLQSDTSAAVARMSDNALLNPNYSKKFAVFTCQRQIDHLRKMEKCHQRERRRQARREALAKGYQLHELNFRDENTMKMLGVQNNELYDTFFSDEEVYSGDEPPIMKDDTDSFKSENL